MLSLKVLLTGAAGQLGQEIQGGVPEGVRLVALTRAQLDITNASAVDSAVVGCLPDVIINAAAYTAVDKAESEPERAFMVNSHGSQLLAEAARGIAGCRLIQISTDYVFDGQQHRSYTLSDTPQPLSVYGRSKWESERAVLEILGTKAVVLRTAWLYSAHGVNFVATMLKLMGGRDVVRVVDDQTGSPTAAPSVAQALWRIVKMPEISGVAHWTDTGSATRFEFACAIGEEGRAAGLLPTPAQVMPIASSEYPTPARRPAHCILDTRETALQLGLVPIPWRSRLRTVIDHMARRAHSGAR